MQIIFIRKAYLFICADTRCIFADGGDGGKGRRDLGEVRSREKEKESVIDINKNI